jgi:hypothetical protein
MQPDDSSYEELSMLISQCPVKFQPARQKDPSQKQLVPTLAITLF